MRAESATWIALVALSSPVVACNDPVHDAEIAALGGEVAGVPKGPTHRPGQPCLVCHGSQGPASPEFSVAGTIYAHPNTKVPVPGTTVRVLDADGTWYETKTNCAGNFLVLASDYAPKFPLYAAVKLDSSANVMQSPMHRDGSCNGCHADPPSQQAEGHVYLEKNPFTLPSGGCP